MSNVISGVLAYAKITEPVNKYQSEEKEFSVDIIVDKATFKAFGKAFPKQKGKTVDNDEFESIYKIKPPFPDQDEQCVLKLKRSAQYKDGTELPKSYWPKILHKVGEDKAVLLEGVLIANGSKGKVSYEITENTYGTFAKLKNVLIEELIEYKKATNPGDDFGIEVEYAGNDFADTGEGENNKPAAKSSKKESVSTGFEDLEEDIPF